ncbi:MAG: aspartate dehydrogenase [Alphaproteobacteria bacterium]|nr:aspartate dehydrogenase [Alphaproteobacteria bacterium]
MTTLRVAVAGLGAIGWPVVQRLDQGLAGWRLVAVSASDRARAEARVASLATPVAVLAPDALAAHADVVVEALPAAVFREVAVPTLEAGRTLVTLSVGALLANDDLVEFARRAGGRIHVPSGALAALDAVRAASHGTIHRVIMRTRKPPQGLAGAPCLEERGFDPAAITAPTRVFAGSAREAAKGFPANVNVAAALALAGIGPDRTTIEIWADPSVTRNIHSVEVDADSTRFTMTIEGVPSEDNPRTGKLTPLSVLATLEGMVAPLHVGT